MRKTRKARKREHISITIDKAVLDKIDEIAELSDRSRSRVIEHILKRYVEAYEKAMEKPNRIIDEVINDAVNR